MRASLKAVADAVCTACVLPAALTCWVESRLDREAEALFGFWTHVCALLPGLPGMYLRRAFYRWTLDACARDIHIGFGALFTHRRARVEREVYVGPYALVGCATLREGCLIASRVSLLSGARPHHQGSGGGWQPTEGRNLQQIEIGRQAWVGEGAIVMVNVGDGGMVGAGAVVTKPVPAGTVVVGNPARPIRRARTDADAPSAWRAAESAPGPVRAIG